MQIQLQLKFSAQQKDLFLIALWIAKVFQLCHMHIFLYGSGCHKQKINTLLSLSECPHTSYTNMKTPWQYIIQTNRSHSACNLQISQHITQISDEVQSITVKKIFLYLGHRGTEANIFASWNTTANAVFWSLPPTSDGGLPSIRTTCQTQIFF